jgi:hypothetical protein
MKKVAQGVPKPKLLVFSGLSRHQGSWPHVISSLCNPGLLVPEEIMVQE